MCEALIRLEDKNLDPITFSQGDVVDIFDDGKFPDKVAYPHAVIKIPCYPKENLKFLLAPHLVYNVEFKQIEVIRPRLYFIDASIIDLTIVTELRTNREITVDSSLINGSVRNRATYEVYND